MKLWFSSSLVLAVICSKYSISPKAEGPLMEYLCVLIISHQKE